MRRLLAVGLVVAVLSPAASSATLRNQPSMTVSLSRGSGSGTASVPVQEVEMYVRSTSAVIADMRTVVNGQPELAYAIRAWKEGDKTRVVVFATLTDKRAPTGRTETPIATYLMAPNQAVDVKEAEAWGTPGLVVRAEVR